MLNENLRQLQQHNPFQVVAQQRHLRNGTAEDLVEALGQESNTTLQTTMQQLT
jgi:hypothetical protein